PAAAVESSSNEPAPEFDGPGPSPPATGVRVAWRRAKGLPASIAVSVAALCVLLPFSRLDLDAHHDGVMLAAAIAVREGHHVQGDVFAQYGPLTPWLQALALLVPISPALALRLLNVVLIALVVFVMSDLGRVKPEYWPGTRWSGMLAAVAWLGVADVFGWVPMLPWSSTVAAALSASAVYCIVRALRECSVERWRVARRWSIAAGVLVGLTPFARLNVGLASLATFLVMATVLAVVRGPATNCARLGLAGVAAGIASVLLVLTLTGSIGDWWHQSIAWPVQWQDSATELYDSGTRLETTVRRLRTPLIVVGAFSIAWLLVAQLTRGRRWIRRSVGLGFGAYVLWYCYLRPAQPELTFSGRIAVGNTWIPEIAENFNYLTLVSWSVIVVAPLFAVTCLALMAARRLDRRAALSWIVLGGFSVAGLVQIWPVSDTRHYWWGLPIGLMFLFAIPSIAGRDASLAHQPNPYLLVTLMSVVISALTGQGYLAATRQAAPTGSPAEGMLMGPNIMGTATARPLALDFELLRATLPPGRRTIFYVNDGIYSVFDGHYHSADAYFVHWGGAPEFEGRLDDLPYVVVDRNQLPVIEPVLDAHRYRLVRRNLRISVYAPPGASSHDASAWHDRG
ncbi:MAG: hypothetical protein HZB15_00485, partial [Actinobacteria bacterium]|nr:hypothetical protein [Actinomycetota bacterium]